MANVGSAASGKTLIGAGIGASPTYASIGTNSGLTAHGVVVAEGNGSFIATSSGSTGQVLTSNGSGSDPSFQPVSASGSVTSITGNTGGAEVPSAGNFNILGTGSITVAGSANTEIVQLTGLTNHAVQVGAGTATLTQVGPGAANSVFQGNGASADPTFNLNLTLNDTNAGLTQGVINWSSSGLRIHDFGTDNIFFGVSAGNGSLTGTDNISIGLNGLGSLTNGSSNVSLGPNANRHITSGSNNVAFGVASLTTATSSSQNTCFGTNTGNLISTGSGGNVAFGYQALNQVTTGAFNTCIGYQAGTNYTSTEANNICIGNGVGGTISESTTTRIGSGQTACFISGIDGVNVGSVAKVVTEASNQLGTATITAGTGITITPTANTITISTSGSGFSPNSTINISDDFFAISGVTGGILLSQLAWNNSVTGFLSQAATSNAHPGIIQNNSFTTNAFISLGEQISGAASEPTIILGGGSITVNWVIKINTLSVLGTRYVLRMGIGDTFNADLANGIYFEYTDTENSGDWVGKTASGSTRTTANSAIAADTSYHNFQISVNASASSVSYFIDGTQIANSPITTNIPTAAITPFISMVATTGTISASSISVDLFYMTQTLTTSR